MPWHVDAFGNTLARVLGNAVQGLRRAPVLLFALALGVVLVGGWSLMASPDVLALAIVVGAVAIIALAAIIAWALVSTRPRARVRQRMVARNGHIVAPRAQRAAGVPSEGDVEQEMHARDGVIDAPDAQRHDGPTAQPE